jgi:hypothetical protein
MIVGQVARTALYLTVTVEVAFPSVVREMGGVSTLLGGGGLCGDGIADCDGCGRWGGGSAEGFLVWEGNIRNIGLGLEIEEIKCLESSWS